MSLKILRPALYLILLSALVIDGAIAQPSDPLSALDARAKFANDYAGKPSVCVKYSKENSNPSLASVRLGEQETALIEVNTNTDGNVSSCNVVKGSGSERLDTASCDWVKGHWRSVERCQNPGPQP